MLFAQAVARALAHVASTGDYRAAARLLRAAGVELDVALFLLLGTHQRPWRHASRLGS